MNLTGGTLNVFGDIKEGNLGAGTITPSLSLNGGTLDMKGNDIGVSGATINTLTFASGELKDVASINGTGGLTKLGAEVAVCGPRSLLPNAIGEMGVTVFDRIEEAVEWADAFNALRLQLERMQAGYIPSLREYNRVYGVTRARLERAPRDILILHPGPMNRGVEIDSEVADDGAVSLIETQVKMGVAMRMAVLEALNRAGGKNA
jgi:ornithine carbamoyltransferase